LFVRRHWQQAWGLLLLLLATGWLFTGLLTTKAPPTSTALDSEGDVQVVVKGDEGRRLESGTARVTLHPGGQKIVVKAVEHGDPAQAVAVGGKAALVLERPVPPYRGSVNVRVWSPAHPERRHLRLNQPGALPLRAGDQVRVEAEVRPAAYLYVVVIDPAGQAQPLYPWKPGQWDSWPADEKPRETLSLPEAAADEGWRVKPGPAGMETVLLLARPTPLTAAEGAELKAAVTGLGPQAAQGPRSVVWFENGQEVKKDDGERSWEFNGSKIDDPVLRTQALLRGRLRLLFAYTRAVSYANAGE
jgi:hypothetical protein